MKITVAGLWHLGCVTSASCAQWFDVVGYDENAKVVESLALGKAPLFEPGLDDLLSEGILRGKLSFSSHASKACEDADVLWVAYDTPVDDNDIPDPSYVLDRIRIFARFLKDGAIVLISSQLPVGSCAQLEADLRHITVAYIPENLQLGKAIQAFNKPERIVVGSRTGREDAAIGQVLEKFCGNIIWMRTESAEMVKHALNSFLALSITFINEIARICEQVGGDAKEVSAGLRSDVRIGRRAYLSPGAAFAGGTLARDITTLIQISDYRDLKLQLIPAVKRSNDLHRVWAIERLRECLGSLTRISVGLLGLTYKPGTNTTRRSPAIDLSRSLKTAGASVAALDPVVKSLDNEDLALFDDPVELAKDRDALVVCTEWPEFRRFDWPEIIKAMRRPFVFDANRFLEEQLSNTEVEYLSVGTS